LERQVKWGERKGFEKDVKGKEGKIKIGKGK